MIQVRLRAIVEASFTKSPQTQLYEYINATKRLAFTDNPNDAIMFISKGHNQVRFVYRMRSVKRSDALFISGAAGKTWKPEHIYNVITSVNVRLNGTWNPLMLQNIANLVDIEIEGIKRFETYYRRYVAWNRK